MIRLVATDRSCSRAAPRNTSNWLPSGWAPTGWSGLIGLEPDQIGAVLDVETSSLPAWDPIRRHVADGEPDLLRMCRSPLRLSIALQAFRAADPVELIGAAPAVAEGRLWDLLMELDRPTFGRAAPDQLRPWLTFLAAGMVREGRQRFWLHELPR